MYSETWRLQRMAGNRELWPHQMLGEAFISNRSEAVFCNSGKLPQSHQTQGQVFWEPFLEDLFKNNTACVQDFLLGTQLSSESFISVFQQQQGKAAKAVEHFSNILLLTKYLSDFYCQITFILITRPELPKHISWEIPEWSHKKKILSMKLHQFSSS